MEKKLTVPAEKRRNGFVTFWLWLGIVASVISGVAMPMAASAITNLGNYGIQLITAGYDFSHASSMLHYAATMLTISGIVSAVCNLTGYILLLKWNRAGFWLIVIAGIIVSGFNCYIYSIIGQAYSELGLWFQTTVQYITQVVGIVIGAVILWAILQIRKGGRSCWNLLD